MTTVLHVVSAGDVGGAERMLVDLAARSAASGVDHAVALFTPNPNLRTFFQTSGVRLFDAGPSAEHAPAFLRRSLGRSALGWLVEQAKSVDARVIHVHTFASQVLGTRAADALKIPLVRTEHSTRVYDDPTCWPFAKWSLARADAIVAISQHIARVVRTRAPFVSPERLRIVPCGVDESRFTFSSPASRSSAGVVDRAMPLRLVAVGRFDRRKGFDLAIQAVARVPEITLELVGGGEERAALERLVRDEEVEARVTMSGWTNDPRDAIDRADAVLCSSRSEGLGLAILEAMAIGRPALALPVGGVPEFVLDGKTGFLADTSRGSMVDALVSLLRRAVENRLALPSLGENAAALVAQTYTATAMAHGYAKVYQALLSDPLRPPGARRTK